MVTSFKMIHIHVMQSQCTLMHGLYSVGGRQLQADSTEVDAWTACLAVSSVMYLAGTACSELASQDFSTATQSSKAGLTVMRAGGLAWTADVCVHDVYHLCMDGLLTCQALGHDPSSNGYSYEGFK